MFQLVILSGNFAKAEFVARESRSIRACLVTAMKTWPGANWLIRDNEGRVWTTMTHHD